MTVAVVEVDNVTISNPSGVLLEDATFTVGHGEIVVILGASGCGKSTLLKHIIGLHAPTRGDIRILGESIVTGDEAARRRITRHFGVLYQSAALFGSMTVLENVMLPLEEHTALPWRMRVALGREKLKTVGLEGVDAYLPDQLSGGMKKRAGLARALALDPRILFLDEPSAGLDPISAAGLDRLVLELRDRLGTSMIIVTHELDSIFAIADRTIVLQNARIAANGPLRETARSGADPWIRDFFTRAGTKQEFTG